MHSGDVLGTPILVLAICIVVFLICREIVCWYWKINEQLTLLREIRDLLAVGQVQGGIFESRSGDNPKQPVSKMPCVISGSALRKLREFLGEDAVQFAEETDSGWNCVCGMQNSNEVNNCRKCHKSKKFVLSQCTVSNPAFSDLP